MIRTIPLFPLPGVVLFPGTLLPLHIFEPRYREMVADALAGDRIIGMAMLKTGLEGDEGGSPIHPIGGAGEIIESEALEDGRYNILLEGRFRFQVLDDQVREKKPGAAYRIARVAELETVPFLSAEEESRVCELTAKIFEAVRPRIELPPLPADPSPLTPERLAAEIALRLRYRPEELQSLLEVSSLPARYAALIGRMMEWQKRVEFLEPFRPGEIDGVRN
ncbi:MAG: LON peptidase substrate-binding domain-containing protein [Acidobacteria bacterium]|nr:LON peptidase substrate-binding domain-containing protein [Acidobacteriota bacterium]MCA1609973.1 LON peptidase substrate-binding domain-containing protein [Acidobacteriota bacterium]